MARTPHCSRCAGIYDPVFVDGKQVRLKPHVCHACAMSFKEWFLEKDRGHPSSPAFRRGFRRWYKAGSKKPTRQ